jgi:hypothetical protein
LRAAAILSGIGPRSSLPPIEMFGPSLAMGSCPSRLGSLQNDQIRPRVP